MLLLDYRMAKGIPRKEAARQLGVDHATLWRWEQGHFKPCDEHMKKIADWSGRKVTHRDFTTGKEAA